MKKITKEVILNLILEKEFELSSTHTKLCVPIINRSYRKMAIGIKFSGIKVEKNLVCDGHHRYLASLLANLPIDRLLTSSTSATIVVDWKSVIFEEDDWDTEAKINMLNEEDAKYNNLSIEQMLQMLS